MRDPGFPVEGRPVWGMLSAAAWLLVCLALPFLPAVHAPGYLQSFLLSAAVPALLPPLFIWVAQWCGRVAVWPGAMLPVVGAAVGVLPVLISGLVGYATGNLCSLEPAVVHTVLGPVFSGVMLAATARFCTSVFPGRRGATLLLYAIMALAMGHTFWVMYSEPQAFAVDHFFGHFRGPLYDEGNPPLERILALRLVTLGLVAVMISVASVLDTMRREGRLAVEGVMGFVASGLLLAGAMVWTQPVRNPGRAGILEELPSVLRTKHSVIHFDGARIREPMQRRIASEVERNITELKQLLRVPVEEPVHVFLYNNNDDKGRLLGAADTLLARPWAREIHVQGNALPIPALRHELAHVLLGELTSGPFKVASTLGFIPHVLVVEGMATALEEHRGELTLMQQAALMKRMNRLPRVEAMMSPMGFYKESGMRAYTAAGSFFRFVLQTRGPDVLRRIYADGSLDALGNNVGEVERAWHAFLDGVEVPEHLTSATRRALRRGSVLERVCSDDVADLWDAARRAVDQDLLEDAETAWRRIRSYNPDEDGPLIALLEASAAANDAARTARVADELLALPLDRQFESQVRYHLARGQALDGELGGALDGFLKARDLAEGAAQRRQLDVLVFASEVARDEGLQTRCGRGALGVLRFIIGTGPERARARSDLLAMERALVDVPAGDAACHQKGKQLRGLLHYLIGRQLVGEDPGRAVPELLEALHLGLPSPLLERETWKLLGEAKEVEGHFAGAVEFYRGYLERCALPGEKEEAELLIRRATFAGAQR